MHSFEVHSNESACRKVDVLGWKKSERRGILQYADVIEVQEEGEIYIDDDNLPVLENPPVADKE